jgi:LysR family transcriptional activator of nhaA
MNPSDLNYRHLLYFLTVAKEGGLRRASEVLHVSQPSISTQLKQLEGSLGASLFNRANHRLILTETGQTAMEYAEEIFSLGHELLRTVHRKPGERLLGFNVGVVDSVPKIVVRQHLAPVFALGRSVNVICREGSLKELITQLVGHKLDVVLADEPSTSALQVKTFNQRVSTSSVVLCAPTALAKHLGKGFPGSLNGAPAVLPVGEMVLRRQLEHWFESHHIRPRVIAEAEDMALLTELAAHGPGFVPVYSTVFDEIARSHRFHKLGIAKGLKMEVFAITAERRLQHPAVFAMTDR